MSSKDNAIKWLKTISSPAKLWIWLTIIVGFMNALLLILQLYLLSVVCHKAFIENQSQYDLIFYFIAMGIIILFRSGLSWLKEVLSVQIPSIVKKQLRSDLISHINMLGPIQLSQISHGKIISSAMEQIEGINDFLAYFIPQLILAGLVPLAILIVILPQSIVCGVILFMCIPLIPIFMILIGKGVESENQKHFKILSRMSVAFLDILHGLSTLKVFNRSKMYINKVFNYSDAYRVKTMQILRVAFLSSAVIEFFSAISIALVAVYLGMGFINSHEEWFLFNKLNLQSGLFILLLAPEFFLPLRKLSIHYHDKSKAIAAAMELKKIFFLTSEQYTENKVFTGEIKKISINNLKYFYHKSNIILKDITLDILKGEKIAIVGPNGSGKTTLINILVKFIYAKHGKVIINNQTPLNTIKENLWLKKISWLGQNDGLLTGSIRDNLLFAQPEASKNELWNMLDLVGLDQEIKGLKDGLDTMLGEKGMGLSEGQKRRLALCRSYLKPCELLILDEPTAGLDKKNKVLIMNSLLKTWTKNTVIMVTHDTSYLHKMDRIILMNHGKIVKQGTPKEILSDEFFT